MVVPTATTDPLPTRPIVSSLAIYATVSGTYGSNSRSTHQRLGAFAGTVLSQLRARGGRSAHLRRLLGRDLPDLRYAARNARGPRDRLIHGAAQHSAAGNRGPSGTLASARPLADRFRDAAGRRHHRLRHLPHRRTDCLRRTHAVVLPG